MTGNIFNWFVILSLLIVAIVCFWQWRSEVKKNKIQIESTDPESDEGKTLKGDGNFRRGAWCGTPAIERKHFEREIKKSENNK